MRVVVIGGGVMGLAAAYQATLDGHHVDLVEAGAEPGGMAAHFDFGGLSIERFYHFVCRTDYATFQLLDELGLSSQMRWVPTAMGLFARGRLHEWGNPVALLRYPGLDFISKVRYGLFAFVAMKRNSWPALEHQSAKEWITRWCGRRVYQHLWEPLFHYKFYEHRDWISAAWIWTRIRRIGRSRRSLMQEELGYLEGGSETLVKALVERITELGGRIHLSCPAQEVVSRDGKVGGLVAGGRAFDADAVISTVPTPLISKIIPDLPDETKAAYDAIISTGVCCLVFKLKKSVSRYFWVNINEPGIEIPGVVEFSNLRPAGASIVYVPYYMPVTHPRFQWSDQALLDEAFACLQRLNPDLDRSDIIDTRVARLRHAQPVCPPGFSAMLPPIQTPIAGLQVADTSFYYPEDRGISESVRVGREMAARLRDGRVEQPTRRAQYTS